MSRSRLIAVLALAAAGCGGAPQLAAQPGPPSGPQGHIAFRRYLDAAQTHGVLFTVNADGSGEKQLTQPPAGFVDDQPDWSPDGTQIAFERCRHDGPCTDVMVVPAQGGTPRKVTARCRKGPECELGKPAWAPDGQLVVNLFEGRTKQLSDGDVWIERSSVVLLNLQTGAQRTLVARDHWQGDTHDPTLSPDGRTLVYQRWNSPRTRPANGKALYAVDTGSGRERRLTPWDLMAGDHPVFSPDGTKVLFHSYDENENTRQPDFWTVRPGGSALTQLTHYKAPTMVLSASYSLDGAWIVHATDGVAGNADLFIMRADGTGARPLTRTKLWDSAPDWGP